MGNAPFWGGGWGGRRVFARRLPGRILPAPGGFLPANMADSGSASGVATGGGVRRGRFPDGFCPFPADFRQTRRVRAVRPASQRGGGFRRGQIPGRILPVPGGFPANTADRAARPAAQRAGFRRNNRHRPPASNASPQHRSQISAKTDLHRSIRCARYQINPRHFRRIADPRAGSDAQTA